MTLALPLLLLLVQADADAPECADPVTQQDMNACAALDWKEADAELNRQWAITAAAMRRLDEASTTHDGRPGYYAQLLQAQRAWLNFRDNHCAAVGYQARGGSLEPFLLADCKAEITRERTGQLRDLAQYPS